MHPTGSPPATETVSSVTSPEPSASTRQGVLVAISDGDGRWLCIRRSAETAAPGQVGLPGGKVEPGETSADASAQEGSEELGARVTPIRPLATRFIPEWDIVFTLWLATLDSEHLNPDSREVESVVWLTADEIAAHPDALPSNLVFAPDLASV